MLERADEVHPIDIGHVDVDQQGVGLFEPGLRLARACTGGQQMESGNLFDIDFQELQGKRFVVDGQYPDHACSFFGVKGMSSNTR